MLAAAEFCFLLWGAVICNFRGSLAGGSGLLTSQQLSCSEQKIKHPEELILTASSKTYAGTALSRTNAQIALMFNVRSLSCGNGILTTIYMYIHTDYVLHTVSALHSTFSRIITCTIYYNIHDKSYSTCSMLRNEESLKLIYNLSGFVFIIIFI